MLKNIALIKTIRPHFLDKLAKMIEAIQIGTTPVRQAEVGLMTIIEIHQVIPGELRDKHTQENPFYVLVQRLLTLNFLDYDCHLTTDAYFETIVRYADYFKGNHQFYSSVVAQFFSDRGIRHGTKAIASQSLNQFLRLTEKYRHDSVFPNLHEAIS